MQTLPGTRPNLVLVLFILIVWVPYLVYMCSYGVYYCYSTDCFLSICARHIYTRCCTRFSRVGMNAYVPWLARPPPLVVCKLLLWAVFTCVGLPTLESTVDLLFTLYTIIPAIDYISTTAALTLVPTASELSVIDIQLKRSLCETF